MGCKLSLRPCAGLITGNFYRCSRPHWCETTWRSWPRNAMTLRHTWSSRTWRSCPVFFASTVMLHALSGRRRLGDVQFYLDQLARQQTEYILHVVSVDIVVDKEKGNAMDPKTWDLWIAAIRRHVIAFFGGASLRDLVMCPRCCCAWHGSPSTTSDPHSGTSLGPPLREDQGSCPQVTRCWDLPWWCWWRSGLLTALRSWSIRQSHFGHFGTLTRHRYESFRLFWQSYSSTPKCTEDPIFARLVGRLRPKANESHGRQSSSTHVGFAIGKNADGSWRTTRLKEYPSVPNPPAAQLSQYVAMDVKEYGCTLGADVAGAL